MNRPVGLLRDLPCYVLLACGLAALGFAASAAVILVATVRRRRPGGELATELAVEGALFASGPVALAATYLLG